jgi:hypothetical protein
LKRTPILRVEDRQATLAGLEFTSGYEAELAASIPVPAYHRPLKGWSAARNACTANGKGSLILLPGEDHKNFPGRGGALLQRLPTWVVVSALETTAAKVEKRLRKAIRWDRPFKRVKFCWIEDCS